MTQEKPKRFPIKFVLSLVGTSMLVSGIIIFTILYFMLKQEEAPIAPYLQGNPDGVRELTQPRELLDFELASQSGEVISLSSLQGQPILLYFGYTHCPDVCLITLSDIKKVRDQLGDDADNVQFVFVSVDGERDTPERLATYFQYQDVADWMIGLSGNETTLQQISVDYGLYYELVLDEADSNGNYPVDHTASTYLVDENSQLVTIFAYGTLPEYITQQIQDLIN